MSQTGLLSTISVPNLDDSQKPKGNRTLHKRSKTERYPVLNDSSGHPSLLESRKVSGIPEASEDQEAEQKIKDKIDESFFPLQNIKRRNPARYMRNPTKVYYHSIGAKSLTLHEGPGY